MCGLVGFLGGLPCAGGDEALLRGMSDTLVHRGPDDAGIWCDRQQRIGLGHRRLAVLDLSASGHQPMVSVSGRFVIAYNGEIYNHRAMREELGDGISWRGHADTETVLAGMEAWGIEATLKKSVGMFAIAVWDRQTGVLILARDRMGEKPLYYSWQGSGKQRVFVFGSELGALKAHPRFLPDVDRGALCLLLRHNYIPAPHSIYQHVFKLEPGSLLSVSTREPAPRVWKYWDALATARAGAAAPFQGTADEAVDALELLARDAVCHQMVADVPLGAFLSGGVDSSTVVALMQAQSSRPVKTFSIGFNEAGYDEALHAKAVAKHLGTEHTELYVTAQDAMNLIPRLPHLYSEPFADPTQIPNVLLSQLARRHVTVSLSGDGGDELFCGYDRYTLTWNQWNKLDMMPKALRVWLSGGVARLLSSARVGGERLRKRAALFSSPSPDELYRQVVSHISCPSEWVVDGEEPPTWLKGWPVDLTGLTAIERMMVLDVLSYLPDDILVKVDRAAMGVSLETRVPFLDHRLVELAWSFPMSCKLRQGQTKWALRQVLYRHVPRDLIDRPKQGFSVPIDQWLRGPLRQWAEALIDDRRLRQEGYFRPEPIRKLWAAQLAGDRGGMQLVWNVLMFQAWLEAQQGHSLPEGTTNNRKNAVVT